MTTTASESVPTTTAPVGRPLAARLRHNAFPRRAARRGWCRGFVTPGAGLLTLSIRPCGPALAVDLNAAGGVLGGTVE